MGMPRGILVNVQRVISVDISKEPDKVIQYKGNKTIIKLID